ncbi:VOC family protein [Vitreoscilla massiliensis]|uniref:VOC family protein n=1 Tax=Vitreoscilla massiliensis TaxID=1689272 RepID=A0ABY4E101_9NEIS|nr:VOC family protein [Vitreoscilla massiliensis]UOO89045.1 VOC family protein [Vitreoscilla massiliensis]
MLLKMDYIEFSCPEFAASQRFFEQAFGWQSVDYGPDYQELQQAGIGAGMARAAQAAPLLVLKSDDLEAALLQVTQAGGRITKDIFAFPGGRRFEFVEPSGTAMAVWSER